MIRFSRFKTFRTKIVIRTSSTLVPNSENVPVAPITNNVRMNTRIDRHTTRHSNWTRNRLNRTSFRWNGNHSASRRFNGCRSRWRGRWRWFCKVDFDLCVGDTDFNHWMRRVVTFCWCCCWFVTLICFTLFAKIEIGANGAFIAGTTNGEFVSFACYSIAVDVRMDQVVTGIEIVQHRWNMFVNSREWMVRMNSCCILNTVIAEIVITTLETFVPDSNDVLWLETVVTAAIPVCIHRNEHDVSNLFLGRDGASTPWLLEYPWNQDSWEKIHVQGDVRTCRSRNNRRTTWSFHKCHT